METNDVIFKETIDRAVDRLERAIIVAGALASGDFESPHTTITAVVEDVLRGLRSNKDSKG